MIEINSDILHILEVHQILAARADLFPHGIEINFNAYVAQVGNHGSLQFVPKRFQRIQLFQRHWIGVRLVFPCEQIHIRIIDAFARIRLENRMERA